MGVLGWHRRGIAEFGALSRGGAGLWVPGWGGAQIGGARARGAAGLGGSGVCCGLGISGQRGSRIWEVP